MLVGGMIRLLMPAGRPDECVSDAAFIESHGDGIECLYFLAQSGPKVAGH